MPTRNHRTLGQKIALVLLMVGTAYCAFGFMASLTKALPLMLTNPAYATGLLLGPALLGFAFYWGYQRLLRKTAPDPLKRDKEPSHNSCSAARR
jgi:hypothetical protein